MTISDRGRSKSALSRSATCWANAPKPSAAFFSTSRGHVSIQRMGPAAGYLCGRYALQPDGTSSVPSSAMNSTPPPHDLAAEERFAGHDPVGESRQ